MLIVRKGPTSHLPLHTQTTTTTTDDTHHRDPTNRNPSTEILGRIFISYLDHIFWNCAFESLFYGSKSCRALHAASGPPPRLAGRRLGVSHAGASVAHAVADRAPHPHHPRRAVRTGRRPCRRRRRREPPARGPHAFAIRRTSPSALPAARRKRRPPALRPLAPTAAAGTSAAARAGPTAASVVARAAAYEAARFSGAAAVRGQGGG
jgi:hypothetical protein